MSDKANTWTINYLPPEGGRYTGKLRVTMANGEEFVFDYGMLSVKRLVAAIDAIAGD